MIYKNNKTIAGLNEELEEAIDGNLNLVHWLANEAEDERDVRDTMREALADARKAVEIMEKIWKNANEICNLEQWLIESRDKIEELRRGPVKTGEVEHKEIEGLAS
ncbi:MAG: hypothetical protein OXC91_02720 [Rhodobacteraceae bacterium]|nr:hypothetical protein [Paracoccaceae bacterium]